MGIMDSIKGLFGGNKDKVKDGIDKTADVVDDKAGAHADQVQKGADMAKDAVDKLPE
jgi:MT0933-like antitoxin protein